MSIIDTESAFCFIHGHAKAIMNILEPEKGTLEYGSQIDGKTEAELMGHLHMLTLYSEKIDEYYRTLVTSDKRSQEEAL